MTLNVRYHSRHIPREHLDFSVKTAHTVVENGLCDVITEDSLQTLKSIGIETVETRLNWNEIEVSPGVFDWSRPDSAVAAIEKAGLKPGIVAWFQHPPFWMGDEYARLVCLEHGESSSIVSLWDPKTLQNYRRLYELMAQRYYGRVGFIYVMIYGDYGEVCYPSGVKHYKFSPKHGHHAFWCGDSYARESYRDCLRSKYGLVDILGERWGREVHSWDDNLMPPMPFEENSLAEKWDFLTWYTDSLMDFCDSVCALAREYFPDTPGGLPIGFVDESLRVGQIKSRAVKIAAKYSLLARWTGMAFLRSFPRSDVLAKRVSSAAHFYGTQFGTEAALRLEKENAANAIYESLSNASSLFHDDPGNIMRAGEIQAQMRKIMRVSRPVSNIGVFYPVEGEMLGMLVPGETFRYDDDPVCGEKEGEPGTIGSFILSAAKFREKADYALLDSTMVSDGFLKTISELVFLIDSPIPEKTCRDMESWLQSGGRAWKKIGCKLTVLETGEPFVPKGLETVAEFPPFEPYASLLHEFSSQDRGYVTVHEDFVSHYDPDAAAREDFDNIIKIAEKRAE